MDGEVVEVVIERKVSKVGGKAYLADERDLRNFVGKVVRAQLEFNHKKNRYEEARGKIQAWRNF